MPMGYENRGADDALSYETFHILCIPCLSANLSHPNHLIHGGILGILQDFTLTHVLHDLQRILLSVRRVEKEKNKKGQYFF